MATAGAVRRTTKQEILALPIAGHVENHADGDNFMKKASAAEIQFYEQVLPSLPALRDFIPTYRGQVQKEGSTFLCLQNVCPDGTETLDVKVRTPLHRDEYELHCVAHLLGCYVHGTKSKAGTFRSGVNGYKGESKQIEHFDETVTNFLRTIGPQPTLVQRLHSLINVLEGLVNVCFRGSSLLFLANSAGASLYFIDFDLFHTTSDGLPDGKLVRSMRQVLLMMRNVWFGPVPTIYLAVNGERLDYTDPACVASSPRPKDIPLSESGRLQATDLAERLAAIRPARIVVSPFLRSIMSAEPLARRLHAKLSMEYGFSEEARSHSDLWTDEQNVSPYIDLSYRSFWDQSQPELDLRARVASTLAHLIEECRGKGDLVIVSHRAILRACLNFFFPTVSGRARIEYGSLSMVFQDVDGMWVANAVSDTSFLKHRSRYGITDPTSQPTPLSPAPKSSPTLPHSLSVPALRTAS